MMSPPQKKALYAVVPAAGIGSRMKADRPKQYLLLNNKTILEYTLEALLSFTPIEKIILPLSVNDPYWSKLNISHHEKIMTCKGGKERCHSVLNGLNTLLQNGAKKDDWVMVHDVARPCIQLEDLNNLYNNATEQGVILGLMVRDTMKRTNENGSILKTIERKNLWHALTPQLASIGILHNAIEQALHDGIHITDEASALEYIKCQPKMLAGSPSNIKVTHPQDLMLANAFLNYSQNKR